MKYLLVLLVVGIGLWSLVSRFRAARRAAEQVPAKPAPTTPGAPVVMRQCAHCGLHLPESDALADGPLRFCSEAHRRLGPRSLPPE